MTARTHRPEMEIIEPPSTTVSIRGRAVEITPIRVKDLPAFVRHVEPVALLIYQGDVMGAVVAHGEDLKAAVAIGAKLEAEWLDEQTIDVLVVLAKAVLEVNADFFVREVLPQLDGTLRDLLIELRQHVSPDGQTSSIGSSDQDTAE